jgi:molybdate transport system regulatory protein
VKPKLRVWIVFGDALKFGAGRAQLLEAIDARGSLRQAARALRMSYRNAWGYLRQLEAAAGFRLVERAPGGRRRGGMRLTPKGRDFLARYGRFRTGLDAVAARRFARIFGARRLSRSASPRSRARSSPG